MSDLNDTKLFGRVVKDAVLKTTANGLKIANFTIAVNRTYKDETGNTVSRGYFFPLAIFDTYAEKMCPYLRKGQRLIVEGYLKQDRWTTKDGFRRSATIIGVSQIHLIFDKKQDAADSSALPADMESALTQEMIQDLYDSVPPDDELIDDADGALF